MRIYKIEYFEGNANRGQSLSIAFDGGNLRLSECGIIELNVRGSAEEPITNADINYKSIKSVVEKNKCDVRINIQKKRANQ